jgi:hypothetical protein
MKTKFELTTVHYKKKEGTRTAWIELDRSTELIPEKNYINCTAPETINFFRRLGGIETITRGYTPAGYMITRILSTSPDRLDRTERIFNITVN